MRWGKHSGTLVFCSVVAAHKNQKGARLAMEPSSSFLAYSTILPTLLFSVSQIILHAIVPQVIVELVCLHESGSENCDGSDVSAKASLLNLVSATIISVPNVLVIGFYASFSKRYGLKPTLLTPVLGNFVFLSLVYLAKLWPTFYRPLIMVGSLVCSPATPWIRHGWSIKQVCKCASTHTHGRFWPHLTCWCSS